MADGGAVEVLRLLALGHTTGQLGADALFAVEQGLLPARDQG